MLNDKCMTLGECIEAINNAPIPQEEKKELLVCAAHNVLVWMLNDPGLEWHFEEGKNNDKD